MIELQISKEDFMYDIQGLCKSFYPSRQIVFGEWMEGRAQNADARMVLAVELKEEGVAIVLKEGEKTYCKEAAAPVSERRVYKNIIKKVLYELLMEVSGKQLPWGTLTGVRPSKLIMERLELGEEREEIVTYMKSQYLCTEEKIDLAYSIAKKEWDILREIDYKNGYSLYIGIPFCPTRCSYCSFPSHPMKDFGQWMDGYLQALYKEIEYVSGKTWKRKLSTIYIGGGTPTTLSPQQLRDLIRKVRQSFPMEHVVEFTVEAGRPDSITYEKLQVLKDEGVTRISINPQSMNDKTLVCIGRNHTVEQIEQTFSMARELGHTNINMDLIIGLPGETKQEVVTTMERLEKLQPESITVHSLVLKRAAKLHSDFVTEKGEVIGDTSAMAEVTKEYACRQGYEPYYMYRQKNATGTQQDSQENIGYSKPGKECIYNILIMEEKQSIVALGAGASSKFLLPEEKKKIERVENVKSVTEYINRIDEMLARKETFLQKHKEELLAE